MNSFFVPVLVAILLCLLQLVVALPWLWTLEPKGVKAILSQPLNWLLGLLGLGVAGLILQKVVLDFFVQDPGRILVWGRIYGAVLQAQLTVDFFVLIFPLLMFVWPHGAAVALAAFREGVRQPMFWLIAALAGGLMLVSPIIPYFSFSTGDDFKMVKELGYETIMLATAVFAVLAASMSISEEIEGRTAVTVMSKPVSRRQFLLGKFAGILLAALLLAGMLGWVLDGVMWFKLWFDGEPVGDPFWFEPARQAWRGLGETALSFVLGVGVWFYNAWEALPGLVFGFCQVMVLLAIAVALATRLPMIVNLVTCLVVFFLGHLTHVLVQVSSAGQFKLVNFMAKFFENVLPGLEYFDLSPVIVRDVPPDPTSFLYYIMSVVLYACVYSIIVLLFGLILFEDRDLA